jgi:hypothetical protein
VLADVLLWEGRHEEAAAAVDGIRDDAAHEGELRAAFLARLVPLRVAIREGRYTEAVDGLHALRPSASHAATDYQRAKLSYLELYCRQKLDRVRSLGARYPAVIAELARTEGFRWEGFARCMFGVFLADIGQTEPATVEIDRAEAVALELGAVTDLLNAANNAGCVLVAAGRYDEARSRLCAALAVERRERHARAEVATLVMLAFASGMAGDLPAARAAAESAAALAGFTAAPDDRLRARALGEWVAYQAGDRLAEGRLVGVAEEARGAHGGAAHLAWMLASDALASLDPARAADYAAEVPVDAQDACMLMRALRLRSEHKRRRSPFRPGPDGSLRVSIGEDTDPLTLDDLKDGFLRWVVSASLARAEGRQARAAEALGISRSRMHDEVKRATGRPARSAKSRPGTGARAE